MQKSSENIQDSNMWRFPEINEKGWPKVGSIAIRDITLREGEQTADIAFTSEEKVKIAMSLSDSGVQQIQCGYSPDDCFTVAELKRLGCKSELELMCVGYSNSWKDQVLSAVNNGADIVHFIFRSDDQHLAELGLDHDAAVERVSQIVSYIKSLGAKKISFGPSFASRADPQFLVQFINAVISGGAEQVVISDSTGVMNPEGFASLVGHVKNHSSCQICVHCHNDFGLALANTVAGVRAGATIVESSLGGFGERAGNVATEEVVFAIHFLYGMRTGIDLKKLAQTSRTAYTISKQAIPPLKPIIGPNAFTQKLDIHVMTTRTKPWLHEPFNPVLVSAERKLVIGKKSGPIAVREKAKELRLELTDYKVGQIVKKVNEFSDLHKRTLTDTEFIEIVNSISREGY